jgi:hypothetical protein
MNADKISLSEDRPERSNESIRHEYDQVFQNVRHYTNLRFAIFSIFFAVIGGVGFVAFGKGQFDDGAVKAARAAGFLVVVVFWLYEARASLFLDHYRKVAVELERMLEYCQMDTRLKSFRYLPSATAVNRVFFPLIFLFWAYAVVLAS